MTDDNLRYYDRYHDVYDYAQGEPEDRLDAVIDAVTADVDDEHAGNYAAGVRAGLAHAAEIAEEIRAAHFGPAGVPSSPAAYLAAAEVRDAIRQMVETVDARPDLAHRTPVVSVDARDSTIRQLRAEIASQRTEIEWHRAEATRIPCTCTQGPDYEGPSVTCDRHGLASMAYLNGYAEGERDTTTLHRSEAQALLDRGNLAADLAFIRRLAGADGTAPDDTRTAEPITPGHPSGCACGECLYRRGLARRPDMADEEVTGSDGTAPDSAPSLTESAERPQPGTADDGGAQDGTAARMVYPPDSPCGTCGHPTWDHDAGECWHGSADDSCRDTEQTVQCPCGWYEPTAAAVLVADTKEGQR